MKIRRKQRRSRVHAMVLGLFTAIVLSCFLGVATIIGVINNDEVWFKDLPSVYQEDAFTYAKESTVVAADGTTVLAEFKLENRVPLTSLDQISPYASAGTVATEDERFYTHQGVDVYGIMRAVVNNLTGSNLEGASTITQQLVRNTIISDEATEISIKRKLREIKLALEMEEAYSKDEILLMYMNTINYGDGCYGIEAAAQHYFSKSAADLNITESATLVGIPQSPTYNNPTAYPDNCLARRNVVLARMLSNGIITQEEYDAAVVTDLNLNESSANVSDGTYQYPYFTAYVRDLLMEEYTTAELFEGGWTIYTTMDVEMQQEAEAACAAQYADIPSGLECALVAMDTSSGAVRAIVGGKDFYENQFNIATQKGRPTGSSFKTFTLATAISKGINPNTLIDCTSPMKYEVEGESVEIENFEGADYGIRSITSATAVSSNTGYVRLIQEVTPASVIEMARTLGVKNAELPEVVSLTLGVADVTLMEMAGAYGTLATYGIYHQPYVIQKIVDRDGKVIFEADTQGTRVISESIAGATTDVLKGVFQYGTATTAQVSGYHVAGKTGTSEGYLDHWLVGYTPTLVCSAWIGDRYNQTASPKINANTLWKTFMTKALEGTVSESFPEYTKPQYDNGFNSEQYYKYSYVYNDTSSQSSSDDGGGDDAGDGAEE